MKVGDLVIPLEPVKQRDWWGEKGSLGIVTEISTDAAGDGVKHIFVRWFGHSDWSFEYSNMVEVISEGR